MKHGLVKATKQALFGLGEWLCDTVPIFKQAPLAAIPDEICILLHRPLGIGDLIMLSPMVNCVAEWARGRRVLVVTEHPPFLDWRVSDVVHPANLWKSRGSRLYISPTLSWRHLKYCFHGDHFVGYFISNRLLCSFADVTARYDPVHAPYIARTFPILEVLGVPYDRKSLLPARPHQSRKEIGIPTERYVCVAPYVSWAERQWPLEHFQELVRRLAMDTDVILVGSGDEKERAFNKAVARTGGARVRDLTGTTSLAETAALIAGADVFVGNDSGPMHIALSQRVPTVAVFGAVLPETRVPISDRHSDAVVTIDARDRCDLFPCYDGFVKPACMRGYVCTRSISVEQVMEAVRKQLARAHSSAAGTRQ